MNKETLDITKSYITSTLREPHGISEESYHSIINLLQVNREFALDLHSIVDKLIRFGDRYYLTIPEDINNG